MRRDDTICSHSLGEGTLSLLEDLSGYRRDKRVMARAKSTRSGLARRSMSKRRSERVEVEGWLAGAADRIKNSVVDAMRDGRRQTGSHFRVLDFGACESPNNENARTSRTLGQSA
jgi:hypothetical protein